MVVPLPAWKDPPTQPKRGDKPIDPALAADGRWPGKIDKSTMDAELKKRGIPGEVVINSAWANPANESQVRLMMGALFEASHYGPMKADSKRCLFGILELSGEQKSWGAYCRSSWDQREVYFNANSNKMWENGAISGPIPTFHAPGTIGGRAAYNVSFDPLGTALHEMAHAETQLALLHSKRGRSIKGKKVQALIRDEVSQYAATNADELIAEVRSGFFLGRRYSDAVMREYIRVGGPIGGMTK